MLHFQSHLAAAPKLEPLSTINHHDDPLRSVLNISSPYQSPWVNPPCFSSPESIPFDEKALELSEMDTLVHQMGDIESWGTLDQAHCCVKPFNAASMQACSIISDHGQLDILNAFLKKHNPAEDVHVNLNPDTDFLPRARSANTLHMDAVVQQDAFGSLLSDDQEPTENKSKDHMLKVPAKRSSGTRPAQLRPTKRGAAAPQPDISGISQREIHIQSERQRRKGMNHLFEKMRSLLPNPTQKTDKSTTVSEIINYIQALHQNLEDLNKKRAKVLPSPRGGTIHVKTEPTSAESIQSECTGSEDSLPVSSEEDCTKQTPHVTLHFNGNDIYITVSCLNKANLLTAIIFVVEDHNLQVISANFSATDTVAFHCLQVKALDTPDLVARQALKCALQKFVCSHTQICFK